MAKRQIQMKKVTTIFLMTIMVVLLVSCSGNANSVIRAPAESGDLVGKKYQIVIEELQDAGFTNIETTAIEDLSSAESIRDGAIETISIDGFNSFTESEEFSPEATVLISYHTIKTAKTPLSSEDLQDKEVSELNQLFVDAGFTNISLEEVYDLNPDTTDDAFKNELTINKQSVFSSGDDFPFDATILIIHHLPYEKHTVTMHIEFISNLIFSRYNVNLLIDGEKQDTLEHGENADYEFRLREGDHTFTFVSAESSSVKGEIAISVICDVDASYEIHCYSDQVDVDTVFVDYKNALAENEAKTMCTESTFLGMDYQEVATTFKELGFTNIKTIPVYDIYFGITETGSTADVTIGGSDDFRRGDVFTKDSEVIISYHMPYEDDPENQIDSESPDNSSQSNESVSYSTNDKETVKNGNTGVYSYKSIGGLYSIYYIIDFDDGYVYYFIDDEEEYLCERVKIDSGDLNSVLIITYHVGGDTWSYGLHFKWKNQPDHLIVQDNDGFEYDYYYTTLKDALAIRDSKTIKDY